MDRLHLRVTPRPSESGAAPTAHHGGVRLGPLMGSPGRGNKHLPLIGAIGGGAERGAEGGGVHVAAVVRAVAAPVGRRGQRAVGDRYRNGSGRLGGRTRRFQFI